jgi:hypothetical protein
MNLSKSAVPLHLRGYLLQGFADSDVARLVGEDHWILRLGTNFPRRPFQT